MRRTLLVFHSPSCGPCAAVMPHVQTFARQGAATVEYFDTSTPDGLAQASELGVRSTPTLLVIDADGKELKRTTTVAMDAGRIGAWTLD